jgi:ABC-2 type transport system permease protein
MNIAQYSIYAAFLREFYYMRHSRIRVSEYLFWPIVTALFWAFVSKGISGHDAPHNYIISILVGVIAWEAFLRAQQTIAFGFLEIVGVGASSDIFLRPGGLLSWLFGLLGLAFVRGSLASILALATIWILYQNISQQITIIALIIPPLLLAGCGIGVCVVSCLMVVGVRSQSITWMFLFLLVPFSCVFYPLSIFPERFQFLVYVLPTTQIFEFARACIASGNFELNKYWRVLASSVGLLSLSFFAFRYAARNALRKGSVTKQFV